MDQSVNLFQRVFFLLKTTLKTHLLRLPISKFNRRRWYYLIDFHQLSSVENMAWQRVCFRGGAKNIKSVEKRHLSH